MHCDVDCRFRGWYFQLETLPTFTEKYYVYRSRGNIHSARYGSVIMVVGGWFLYSKEKQKQIVSVVYVIVWARSRNQRTLSGVVGHGPELFVWKKKLVAVIGQTVHVGHWIDECLESRSFVRRLWPVETVNWTRTPTKRKLMPRQMHGQK